MILSLRPKDLVATFNWDPFLYLAFSRNRRFCDGPRLSFLHGNVAIGFSVEDQKAGPAGWYSKATSAQFVPTKLLYPVAKKDYNKDEFTRREWERLKRELRSAKRMTIFGYGAPETDVEAVDLMKTAWGDPNQRNLELVEIIDIQPRSWYMNDGISLFTHIITTTVRAISTQFSQNSPAAPESDSCINFCPAHLKRRSRKQIPSFKTLLRWTKCGNGIDHSLMQRIEP